MKKIRRIAILGLMLCMAGLVSAAPVVVNYAELAVAQGGSAVYDAAAGTIAWSGGASGKIGLVDGSYLTFDQPGTGVTITGNLSGTPGAGAGSSLTLSNLTFSLTYAPYGQTQDSGIVISGTLSDQQVYMESLFNAPGLGTILQGIAGVDVTAVITDGSDSYTWVEATGSKLETTIMGVGSFSDYSQDYNSNNMRITVYGSDYVPEPATMTLLGLGAVSLFSRRRRK